MPDAFIPLSEYLRAPAFEAVAIDEPSPAQEAVAAPEADDAVETLERALSDLRCFRAALADALDARLERLLLDLACSVLARDLRLAPADLATVVAREVERAGEPPVRLRAHPDECSALGAFGCPVVADPTLLRGDVTLDLRSGTIRSTLGVRLERALAEAAR
jgi:flagellar biosynthesis/type III secretory pathway protein FliH